MKDSLRDLFTFSAGERKGVIVLIIIILIMGIVNMVLVLKPPAVISGEYPVWMNDPADLPEHVNRSEAAADSAHGDFPDLLAAIHETETLSIDPNVASFDELLRLGLGLRICRIIVNYRSKGGRFNVPADLKKIYGMTQEMYDRVLPHILINKAPAKELPDRQLRQIAVADALDINHADSAQFESLPGIGPVLSGRIIKYRNLLGGFYCKQQLKEVYGIDTMLYSRISEKLAADTSALKKISLNSATEQEIAHHPYIGRYIAKGILHYRADVKTIKNIEELRMNGLVTPDRFEKIRYYLCL